MFSFVMALAIAATPPPQSISVPASVSGHAGELIEVKADSGADLISWSATPGLRIVSPFPPDVSGKSILVHSRQGGTFTLVASVPEGKAVASAVCVVTVEAGEDKPQPKPRPDPNAPPVAFVVVIEETGEAAATRGALFADAKLQSRLKDKRIGWRVADKDVRAANGQPPADLVGYLERAKGKPLPQVFLVTAAGQILFQGDLPATAAGLVELLSRHGG